MGFYVNKIGNVGIQNRHNVGKILSFVTGHGQFKKPLNFMRLLQEDFRGRL